MFAASFLAIIGLLSLISVSFRDASRNGNSQMKISKIVSDGLMFVVGIATNQDTYVCNVTSIFKKTPFRYRLIAGRYRRRELFDRLYDKNRRPFLI